MKILLVGNYPPDRQESMRRFVDLMEAGLTMLGHTVRRIYPQATLVSAEAQTTSGLSKWLGYLDKYVLFPRQLRRVACQADVVHICDHSNAIYSGVLQGIPHVVTCHDLLAIRGAWGDPAAACPASMTGKLLQRWILRGLRRSRAIACVSAYTQADVEAWVGGPHFRGTIRLICNGLNHSYGQLSDSVSHQRLERVKGLDLETPFLLNIGSNLPRKNRDGILRVMAHLRERWPGNLVFAGAALTGGLRQLVAELKLSGRIIEVHKPSNDLLEALYNRAFALMFPSRAEGFGWPIVEAQACGCPTICSDRTALPEVAGEAGIVCDPDDIEALAAAVLTLEDSELRAVYVRKGLENVMRFTPERSISKYVALYEELVAC